MKFIALLALPLLLTACLEAESKKTSRPPLSNPGQVAVNPSEFRSQLHRDRTTVILSTTQEARQANSLPVGYENIPNILEADDGQGPRTQVVYATHTAAPCGNGANFATIQARIQDCATINPTQSTWNGQANGTAGEGNWVLVVRNGINQEVWLDQTTNYLWSDRVAEASSWCDASGNTQAAPTDGNVDCFVLNTNQRNLCSGMSISILPDTQVSWRLPTRADFLLADINGARFVLNSIGLTFWTATVSGADRDQAWSIEQSTGMLSTGSRAESRAVRCIGRRL